MGNYLTGPTSDKSLDQPKNLTIDELLTLVETGDIILLSGGSFDSQFIEFATNAVWSHVLMVAKVKIEETGEKVIAAFESVYSSDLKVNIFGNPAENGVRLVRLKEYLEGYKGYTAAVRFLCIKDKDAKKRKALIKHLKDVLSGPEGAFDKYINLPYETSWMEFIGVFIGGLFGKARPTKKEMFCSELVGTVFEDAGILDTSRMSPNQLAPEAFWSASDLPLKMPDVRLGYVSLSPEWYIQLNHEYRPSNFFAAICRHLC